MMYIAVGLDKATVPAHRGALGSMTDNNVI